MMQRCRGMRRMALLSALIPASALAQDAPALAVDKSVFDGDFLIIGAGPVAAPSYEGSDSLSIIPAAGVAGRIGGITINPRAAGIALDIVPDSDQRIGFTFGPVLRYRTNRSGKTGDEIVAKLGKLKGVVEGGVTAGAAIKRVFNPHDSLSLSVDVRWDISGRGSGYIVSPGVSYLTPVSRAQVVGLAATANFIDARYARYNFSVTQAGSTASGLPVYDARGGFKDWNLGVFTARDLDADFLNGGFAIAVGGMYSHLYGSAAASPVTRIRGKESQWLFGGGLAYIF